MEQTEAEAKRRQDFLDWDAEHVFPETIGTYRFHRIDRQEERIYFAFGYLDEETGWDVRVLYDDETQDFMVKAYARLFTLTFIDMINGDFETFKEKAALLLAGNIKRQLLDRRLSVVVQGRGFTVWDFASYLPEKIGNFKRMIAPDAPILGLNGSYIIATYENREEELGILFFYNMFRDEYYAEKYAKGIPIILHDYDAKTIEEFSEILKSKLTEDLEAAEKTFTMSN